MNVEQSIIRVIIESGERGISSRRIALHVHGELNSMFNPLDVDDVTDRVRRYIQKQMRKQPSLIERIEGTHRFRINPQAYLLDNSSLVFQFTEETISNRATLPKENGVCEPSLFDYTDDTEK